MSDYLHHLVARTLSSDTGVRPQLRSAFEPAPLGGGFTLPTDFESQTLVESNPPVPPPPASLPLIASLLIKHKSIREYPTLTPVIPPARLEAPRQDATPAQPNPLVGEMPFAERNEDQEIAPVQPLPPPLPADREQSMKLTVLQQVIQAPPDSYPENIRAVPTPPSASRLGSIPAPRPRYTASPSDTRRPEQAVPPSGTVEPEESRAERLAMAAIRSVAPTASVILPSQSAAPNSERPRPAAAIRRQTVEPQVPGSERLEVAAIRPVATAAPVFSPSLPPAVAPALPTIHVTIGRVEIRAMPPPPAAFRAQATLPPVMSLEQYLGRRAAGGQR